MPCECDQCGEEEYWTTQVQKDDAFAYHGFRTLSETTDLLQEYLQRIKSTSKVLNSVLAAHGETLVKQWRRRTAATRRNILLQAHPDLYPCDNVLIHFRYHNHDWESSRWNSTETANLVRKYRLSLLLPYMNLETLSEDHTKLICLLHHRITHKPADWAIFDSNQLHTAWSWGKFDEPMAPGCVTMHGEHYGR